MTQQPGINFNTYDFIVEDKNLSVLQIPQGEDKIIVQNIFTLINILDINKDATTTPAVKPNERTPLNDFFEKFIPNIKNIPLKDSILKEKLHLLENRFIPTLRNINIIGDTVELGFKTMFIVPLISEVEVVNNSPIVSEKTNFIKSEYTECTVDVAYNPKKYSSTININETPGSYIDPGDRTKNVNSYIPQEQIEIDLTKYGLPDIKFIATKIGDAEIPKYINVSILFEGNSKKFENIKSIVFTIDRDQNLKGDTVVTFNDGTQQQFNNPNIFKGNNQKNTFISNNFSSDDINTKIMSFLFLLGKLLGDLMQIVFVKETKLKENLNQFILFTNDLVVAFRCVFLKIPFLLSINYGKEYTSNCNVLYFYDDITALQQFKLIQEEKKTMIKKEISKLENFESQLSKNTYIKKIIQDSKTSTQTTQKITDEIITRVFDNEEFKTYYSKVIENIKEIIQKLKLCINKINEFQNSIQVYKSENNIKEFSELVRVFSSIKIVSLYEIKNDKYIFSNNNKFVSVKLPRIISNPDLNEKIESIINILNDSSIQDSGRKNNLRKIMDEYKMKCNSLYDKIKSTLSSQGRTNRREKRKLSKMEPHQESIPPEQQSMSLQQELIPPHQESMPPEQQSMSLQQESMKQVTSIDDSNDSDDSDDETLAQKAKRIKYSGGVKYSSLNPRQNRDIDIITHDIDTITHDIYSIFYSYCNYYGITLLKNSSLFKYLYTLYNRKNYEFELNNSKIETIFNSEKLNINNNINNDYDAETNMDSSITDPDKLTKNVIINIRDTISSILLSQEDKENKESITGLKTTIKKRRIKERRIKERREDILLSRNIAGRPNNVTIKIKKRKPNIQKPNKRKTREPKTIIENQSRKKKKIKQLKNTVKLPKQVKNGGKRRTQKRHRKKHSTRKRHNR